MYCVAATITHCGKSVSWHLARSISFGPSRQVAGSTHVCTVDCKQAMFKIPLACIVVCDDQWGTNILTWGFKATNVVRVSTM